MPTNYFVGSCFKKAFRKWTAFVIFQNYLLNFDCFLFYNILRSNKAIFLIN